MNQFPEPCLIHMTTIMCLRSIALVWDAVVLLAKFDSEEEASKSSWGVLSNPRSPASPTAMTALGAFTLVSSSAGGEAGEDRPREASWNLSVLSQTEYATLFDEIMSKADMIFGSNDRTHFHLVLEAHTIIHARLQTIRHYQYLTSQQQQQQQQQQRQSIEASPSSSDNSSSLVVATSSNTNAAVALAIPAWLSAEVATSYEKLLAMSSSRLGDYYLRREV